jgi:hypothetical protein
MLKRYLCITAAAAALLSAADAPKTLSPDFMKAGLKAVISIKNSGTAPAGMTFGSKELAASAMTDAEAAIANENDRKAYERIGLYHIRYQMDDAMINIQLKRMSLGGTIDKEALLAMAKATAACRDVLQKMLHGGELIETPECDDPKGTTKK